MGAAILKNDALTAYDDLLNGIRTSSVANIAVLVCEVQMRIGVLTQVVSIRVYYTGKGAEPFYFETSALMKTRSDQPPRDANHDAASEVDALRRAIRMLTEDYELAVRNGEMPQDSWLVASGR